jgi:hypothetical protein
VTLGRLLVAWVLVAAWFLAAGWAGRRLVVGGGGGTFPAPLATRVWTAAWTLAEAGVVTLLASLWFDSLGSGGWWLLFLLVGLIAAWPRASTLPRRTELLLAVIDTARYVGAGALLSWRLGS